MKIYTNVEMFIDEVSLSLHVTKNLKREEGNLKGFGHIRVSRGDRDESKDCFWDGIQFFVKTDYEEFKKECKQELREKGFEVKKTYKDIKKLLKRAKKINIL